MVTGRILPALGRQFQGFGLCLAASARFVCYAHQERSSLEQGCKRGSFSLEFIPIFQPAGRRSEDSTSRTRHVVWLLVVFSWGNGDMEYFAGIRTAVSGVWPLFGR